MTIVSDSKLTFIFALLTPIIVLITFTYTPIIPTFTLLSIIYTLLYLLVLFGLIVSEHNKKESKTLLRYYE